MTTLTCPKCRQGMPDDALDAGHCPACGFPLDGPFVFATPGSRPVGTRLLLAAGAVTLLAGAGYTSYMLFSRTDTGTDTEVADREREPDVPVRFVAPVPHEPKRLRPRPGGSHRPTARQQSTGAPGDKGPPPVPPVDPPKKAGPRPIGVVMKVDPKIAPQRHFDHPDDTAALPDLNTNDRVVLTGRVRALRLGSVNGNGSVDASGLVAEEVIITGDLNGEATVTVNAPNGKVALGGYVAGASKLTIRAAGRRSGAGELRQVHRRFHNRDRHEAIGSTRLTEWRHAGERHLHRGRLIEAHASRRERNRDLQKGRAHRPGTGNRKGRTPRQREGAGAVTPFARVGSLGRCRSTRFAGTPAATATHFVLLGAAPRNSRQNRKSNRAVSPWPPGYPRSGSSGTSQHTHLTTTQVAFQPSAQCSGFTTTSPFPARARCQILRGFPHHSDRC